MKTQKGFALLPALLIALLIAVILGGGYYAVSKMQAAQRDTSLDNIPALQTGSATSSSNDAGLVITYPTNHTIVSPGDTVTIRWTIPRSAVTSIPSDFSVGMFINFTNVDDPNVFVFGVGDGTNDPLAGSATWKVPADIKPGTYKVTAYLQAQPKDSSRLCAVSVGKDCSPSTADLAVTNRLIAYKAESEQFTVKGSAVVSGGFTGTPISGTAPLTVHFGQTLTDDWRALIEYGDGVVCAVDGFGEDSQCPNKFVHTYSRPGTYTVALRSSTGTDGASRPPLATLTIKVSAASGLSASPTSGPAPLTVTFVAPPSAGGDYMNFGDGSDGCSVSGAHNDGMTGCSMQSGVPFYYTYSTPGVYHVSVSRLLPSTILGTADITVTGSSQVSGMSKYTDTDFGFSFWYPSGWTINKNVADYEGAAPVGTHLGDGVVVSQFDISNGKQHIIVNEISSATRSVHVGNDYYGYDTYYFDTTNHTWMDSITQAANGSPDRTIAVDVSNNTMGGLHIFSGGERFGVSSLIPLSAHNFLRVTASDFNGASQMPLVRTILATDPSVATPVSVGEQQATIQAEKSAYAGN